MLLHGTVVKCADEHFDRLFDVLAVESQKRFFLNVDVISTTAQPFTRTVAFGLPRRDFPCFVRVNVSAYSGLVFAFNVPQLYSSTLSTCRMG